MARPLTGVLAVGQGGMTAGLASRLARRFARRRGRPETPARVTGIVRSGGAGA